MFQISRQVNKVLSVLQSHGFEGYLVGGCVRDYLMGKDPKDYDIATDASPIDVMKMFEKEQVIPTGLRHGTVTVIMEHVPIEITTYRIEQGYSDRRHPDQVAFTDNLKEDLARRDFTMNAIAYHPSKGFVDPFGGAEDIQARRIRSVGKAEKRFEEDDLRILRALRFASVLDFTMSSDTEKAVFAQKEALLQISSERVREELTKMLCGQAVQRVLLLFIDVIGVVIPELLPMKKFDQRTKYHCHDVLVHTAVALENTPPDRILRWVILLHDIGKPGTFTIDKAGAGHFYGHNQLSGEMADQLLQRLKFDTESRKHIVNLISIHDVPIEPKRTVVHRWLVRLTPPVFFELLQIKRADNLGQDRKYQQRQQEYDRLEEIAKEILEAEQCFSLRDLAVNGRDMIEQGYAGKAIGDRLQYLLDAVLDGEVSNQKEALLAYLNRGKNEGNKRKET